MPSPTAQAALIRDTYARAGLDISKASDRPQYFEAHGTGMLYPSMSLIRHRLTLVPAFLALRSPRLQPQVCKDVEQEHQLGILSKPKLLTRLFMTLDLTSREACKTISCWSVQSRQSLAIPKAPQGWFRC